MPATSIPSAPARGGGRTPGPPDPASTRSPARTPASWPSPAYVADLPDPYAAPRTLVEDPPPATTTAGPLSARAVAAPVADRTRTAGTEIAHDGTTTRVDLGLSAARTTADGTEPSRPVTLADPAQAH